MWMVNLVMMVSINCDIMLIHSHFHLHHPSIVSEVRWKRNETITGRHYVTSYETLGHWDFHSVILYQLGNSYGVGNP